MKKTIITLASISAFAGFADAQTFAQYPGAGGVPASATYVNTATGESWNWTYTANKDHPSTTAWGAVSLHDYTWTITFDHPIDFNQLGTIIAFSDLDVPLLYTGTISVSGGTATTNTLAFTGVDDGVSSYDGATGNWSYDLTGSPSDVNDLAHFNGSTGTFTTLTFAADTGTGAGGDLIGMSISEATGYDMVDMVPEPSSTALLGLGGLALLIRRKRA